MAGHNPDFERFLASCRKLLRRAQNFRKHLDSPRRQVELRRLEQCLTLVRESFQPLDLGGEPQSPFHELYSSVSSIIGTQMTLLEGGLDEDGDDWDGTDTETLPAGLSGSIVAISLSDVIGLLSMREKTGVLRVKGSGESIELFLEDGVLVHACSDHSPPGCRLGEILVAQRSLTAERLQEFLVAHRGRRIGAALEEEALVTRDQLRQALETQVHRLFDRLIAVEDGSFSFHEGLPPELDRRIALNLTYLLLESARAHDESGVS